MKNTDIEKIFNFIKKDFRDDLKELNSERKMEIKCENWSNVIDLEARKDVITHYIDQGLDNLMGQIKNLYGTKNDKA